MFSTKENFTMSHIIMIEESNGNGLLNVKGVGNNSIVPSISNDDLSQSLSISEYTDADESMSAPTEFLAEFLSAVMLKDYKKALKYCKLILEFEPNNITAKEFYPLIMEKLKLLAEKSSSDSDENFNNTSSSPDFGEIEGGYDGATDAENSSNEVESDFSSNNSDDSADEENDEKDGLSNSNASSHNSSGAENTTHSYSSSLLEEDDDLSPLANVAGKVFHQSPSLSDLNNGNYHLTSYSDSESPTEPLTQQIAAILRSKLP